MHLSLETPTQGKHGALDFPCWKTKKLSPPGDHWQSQNPLFSPNPTIYILHCTLKTVGINWVNIYNLNELHGLLA
jgi:hypothetical protein